MIQITIKQLMRHGDTNTKQTPSAERKQYEQKRIKQPHAVTGRTNKQFQAPLINIYERSREPQTVLHTSHHKLQQTQSQLSTVMSQCQQ